MKNLEVIVAKLRIIKIFILLFILEIIIKLSITNLKKKDKGKSSVNW